jgi:hypothetical protein
VKFYLNLSETKVYEFYEIHEKLRLRCEKVRKKEESEK